MAQARARIKERQAQSGALIMGAREARCCCPCYSFESQFELTFVHALQQTKDPTNRPLMTMRKASDLRPQLVHNGQAG